jgi:hypothetical protein
MFQHEFSWLKTIFKPSYEPLKTLGNMITMPKSRSDGKVYDGLKEELLPE